MAKTLPTRENIPGLNIPSYLRQYIFETLYLVTRLKRRFAQSFFLGLITIFLLSLNHRIHQFYRIDKILTL